MTTLKRHSAAIVRPACADGSLHQLPPINVHAAYLSAHAPPAVGTIGGRRRIVSRRRGRPRRKASQQHKYSASSCIHSASCGALRSSFSPPDVAPCGLQAIGFPPLAATSLARPISYPASYFHIMLFPLHGGATASAGRSAFAAANGLPSRRYLRAFFAAANRAFRARALACRVATLAAIAFLNCSGVRAFRSPPAFPPFAPIAAAISLGGIFFWQCGHSIGRGLLERDRRMRSNLVQ